jgi:poly-gamma-glutamate synthesis protein (capsule biosynthesis protein)
MGAMGTGIRRRAGRRRFAVAIALAANLTWSLAGDGSAASATDVDRDRITIAFTGDLLATHATWATARALAGGRGYDFRPMLARLRPLVSSADLALCHLETPLTGLGVPLSDYPRYAVPHQLAAAAAWAGYDGCSTASNHSLDHGRRGIVTTLRRLDALDLGHVGTARTRPERRRGVRYRLRGARVDHLSYTASFNGLEPRRAWEANRIDARRIITDARRSRRHGADIVVVSLHWGTEHRHAPTSSQTDLARRLSGIDAIDLLVGHHAHVVQPIRRPGGTWTAYGLGNSLSGMTASLFSPSVQDGVVLLTTFEQGPRGWGIARMRYAPTWVRPTSWIVRLVGPALDAGRLPGWELRELRRSWRRTVSVADQPGLDLVPFRRARLGSR